ncbi:MAG: hypothetical protein ACKVQR_16600 [Aquabacterium sp.]
MKPRRLLAGLLALIVGCSSSPRLDTLSAGQDVAVIAARPAGADARARIRNVAVGMDAGIGGGAGMVAGGLAGAGCGPLAFLCIPAGVLAGAVAGAGLGAVVGLAAGLSAEQEALLQARLALAQQRADPPEHLRRQVAQRLNQDGHPGPQPAAVTVTVQWGELHFVLGHGERLGMVASVPVTVQRHASAASQTRTFVYSGPMVGLPIWLDDRSDFLEASLSTAVQQIAAQIAAELAARGARRC